MSQLEFWGWANLHFGVDQLKVGVGQIKFGSGPTWNLGVAQLELGSRPSEICGCENLKFGGGPTEIWGTKSKGNSQAKKCLRICRKFSEFLCNFFNKPTLHSILGNDRSLLTLRILGCEQCFIIIVIMAFHYSNTMQYLIWYLQCSICIRFGLKNHYSHIPTHVHSFVSHTHALFSWPCQTFLCCLGNVISATFQGASAMMHPDSIQLSFSCPLAYGKGQWAYWQELKAFLSHWYRTSKDNVGWFPKQWALSLNCKKKKKLSCAAIACQKFRGRKGWRKRTTQSLSCN